MHYLDQFSAAVRTARQEKKISQEALANKLSMNKRTIMDFENGKTNPRAETIFLLASVLGISIDAILFNEGPDAVSPSVFEFFSGKTQDESNRYIVLCQQADALSKQKYRNLELYIVFSVRVFHSLDCTRAGCTHKKWAA